MDRCAGAVARLPENDRKDLAIQALAGSEAVSDLAARHGVSRKFVYEQTHKVLVQFRRLPHEVQIGTQLGTRKTSEINAV
jgi:hypothetical protein